MTKKLPVFSSALIAALLATLAGAQTTQTVPGAGMPPGHPSMEQLMGMGLGGAPASQPAALGTLSLQVTAGTAGAPAIGPEPVTIELYHRGTALSKIDSKLDQNGALTLNDLPIMPPVQALITVKHAGLDQQVVSPELSPMSPKASLTMKVFESTQEKPAWTIAMQHMILQWTDDGQSVQVTEMLSASNPADRTWLGTSPAKEGDPAVTLSIPISAGAQDIRWEDGFDDSKTALADGRVVTGSPLYPGRSEFRISYKVPAHNGAVSLSVTTPSEVGNLYVFLPASGAEVTATGLTGGDAVDMGQGSVRVYKADHLAAGQTVTLALSGLGVQSEAPATSGGLSAKNVALGGAFLLVLAGAGMMMLRKPHVKQAKRA